MFRARQRFPVMRANKLFVDNAVATQLYEKEEHNNPDPVVQ